MEEIKTLDEFKNIIQDFLRDVERQNTLGEYFTEEEIFDMNRKEELIYSTYKHILIYIEFLQFQLNYEYGNTDEKYFVEKSKEYLKIIDDINKK